jgi:hypothetical protein
MPALQTEYITILGTFERLFSQRIWKHAKILLTGAILSPAERTVTAALRVMGLSMEKHFQNYHRVLNRAAWSSLEASRLLLGLLVSTFARRGPIIMGLDDTIERRRGAKIKAKGIYRDPVRSSHGHFVKASELDVVGPHSMGWTDVGFALSHCAGTFREILSKQTSQAQETYRVGSADDSASSPLAAETPAGGGGRQ